MEPFLSKLRNIWGRLPSFQQRVITALILAPLFLLFLYWGGIFFTLLIIVTAVLAYREWLPLVQSTWQKSLEYTAYGFLALALLVATAASFKLGLILLGLGFVAVTILAHFYVDQGDRRAPPWLSFGVLYIGLPCLAILWLRQYGVLLSPDKAWAPTALLFFQVWATDTGAYVAGRKFGGRKLAPSVSPNKTWSGLIGGMICSALVMGGCAMAWHFKAAGWYFPAGFLLAFIAQMGDLFESHLKRRAGVKDSGHIIPGHGGILDRIDGLLTAAPAFFLFILLLL